MSQVSIPQSVLCFHGPFAPVIEGDGKWWKTWFCENAGVLKFGGFGDEDLSISSCVCSTVNCTLLAKTCKRKEPPKFRPNCRNQKSKITQVSQKGRPLPQHILAFLEAVAFVSIWLGFPARCSKRRGGSGLETSDFLVGAKCSNESLETFSESMRWTVAHGLANCHEVFCGELI